MTVRNCDTCAKLRTYRPDERGDAWLRVEVFDGGEEEPTLIACFCSLRCLEAYFLAPDKGADFAGQG